MNFDANGLGFGARLDLSENVDVRSQGMSYDDSENDVNVTVFSIFLYFYGSG